MCCWSLGHSEQAWNVNTVFSHHCKTGWVTLGELYEWCKVALDIIQIKLHLPHFPPLLINTEATSPNFFLWQPCPQELLWKSQDRLSLKPASMVGSQDHMAEDIPHNFHYNIPPHTSRVTAQAWEMWFPSLSCFSLDPSSFRLLPVTLYTLQLQWDKTQGDFARRNTRPEEKFSNLESQGLGWKEP